MKRHIIITARKGAGKHRRRVNGRPLVWYPMDVARHVRADTKTVWTDCPEMAELAVSAGLTPRDRPLHMCTDTSPHYEIIEHAVSAVMSSPEDIVIVLLGNTTMVSPSLLNGVFDLLEGNEDYDSALTVWKAQDDHPLRALIRDQDGKVVPYITDRPAGTTSSRQSYADVWFYDQGVWAFRARCAAEKAGPEPWVWLGSKVALVEREWVTGRDVHSTMDLQLQELWQSGAFGPGRTDFLG